MYRLICSFKECPAFIEVEGPVASVARYTCRLHVGKNPTADIHFQQSQFDPQIGSGTDPKFYEAGRGAFGVRKGFNQEKSDELRSSSSSPRKFIEKVIRKAGPELANHENRDEIVEILKEDVRDHNVGVTKSGGSGE